MSCRVFLRIALIVLVFVLPLTVAGPATANHEYTQPVWFNWNSTELKVLVMGVDDPIIMAAILRAIEAWETGIQELAPAWLADSFNLIVYVPAIDPVPPAGFDNLNNVIFFVPQGFMAIKPGSNHCIATAPMTMGPWPSSYFVALHEFGHCLGLGHVFNHGQEYQPCFDPLGAGCIVNACPSNLNIKVMERVFSGQGGSVTMSSSDYYQSDCL